MRAIFFESKKQKRKYKSDFWEQSKMFIVIALLVYSIMTGVILYLGHYL